jgi:hypothetical protein
MSDFYQDMQKMARDLLAPTSSNGLGQGTLVLTSITPGTPDPTKPWEPVTPQTTTLTLRGAVKGVSSKLIGVEVGGTVIVATDKEAITEVPSIAYKAGDLFSVDGKEVRVLSVQPLPAAGTACAVRWVIR